LSTSLNSERSAVHAEPGAELNAKVRSSDLDGGRAGIVDEALSSRVVAFGANSTT
jgi:hypothetical protein